MDRRRYNATDLEDIYRTDGQMDGEDVSLLDLSEDDHDALVTSGVLRLGVVDDPEQTVRQRSFSVEIADSRNSAKRNSSVDEQDSALSTSHNGIRALSNILDDISVPVHTQRVFDSQFGGNRIPEPSVCMKLQTGLRNTFGCSKQGWKSFINRMFPFVSIMKSYSWREDLPGDIVSGLTVGILNIPQGMAYALLASVPPIYGLYVSFFPVLVYFFFGGSRHISIGTFAVITLMIGSTIDTLMPSLPFPSTNLSSLTTTAGNFSSQSLTTTSMSSSLTFAGDGNTQPSTSDPMLDEPIMQFRIRHACLLALLIGLFQIVMSLLRLGLVTVYLSDALISGFTTGAACHVFTSQVKYVFGIHVTSYHGPFKIIYTYIDLLSKIATVNYADLIITAVCLIVLVLVKECINARYEKKLKMPIPIDLIVVVLGTVVSYYAKLNTRYNVEILAHIPLGFPAPAIPPMSNTVALLPGTVSIGIVAFAITVSMSKLYAKKFNYEIDSNQELLALGITNCVCSFFSCFASCASLSRSVLQVNTGGKTQIAGLVSCSLILVVLVALGPYLEPLPNSVLAAIILVALKGMFMQFKDLKKLWSISLYDFSIWLVTWLAVVILDVEIGLAVGVVFGILTAIYRSQFSRASILAHVPGEKFCKEKHLYPVIQEVNGVKVFQMDGALWYANAEHFRNQLYKLTGANPRLLKNDRARLIRQVSREMRQMEKLAQNRSRGQVNLLLAEAHPDGVDDSAQQIVMPAELRPNWPRFDIHHVVIDCSLMAYVDSAGIDMLKTVCTEYKEADVIVFFSCCKAQVLEMFERCSFYNIVPRDDVFVITHYAIIEAVQRNNNKQRSVSSGAKDISERFELVTSGRSYPV